MAKGGENPAGEEQERLLKKEREEAKRQFTGLIENDDGGDVVLEYEDDYISQPILSPNSTVPENILEWHHSFGWNASKNYTVTALANNCIAWVSGSFIHFLNLTTQEVTLRRSATGNGLCCITKDPKSPVFAVAERGPNPLILVLTWPELNVVSVMTEGTKHEFICLDFSRDRNFLLSQSGKPDLILAVWNWKRAIKVIECKLDSEIFKSSFAKYNQGILTCGKNYMKFLTMERTRTGLKLWGDRGEFGYGKPSDITTYVDTPHCKYLSNNMWGTMFCWGHAKLSFEICRPKGKPCHDGYISLIEYLKENNEILTIGSDGKYCIWECRAINEFQFTHGSKHLELQPLYEDELTDSLGVPHITNITRMDENFPYHFVAQDTNGSIWILNLKVHYEEKEVEERGNVKKPVRHREDFVPPESLPKRIYTTHTGPIFGLAASPAEYYLASLGRDGKIFIYDISNKKILMHRDLKCSGSALYWLPMLFDKTGSVLIAGFTDGTIRVVIVSIKGKEIQNMQGVNYINVIEALKPHNDEVTFITRVIKHKMLVTGSRDGSLFLFRIEPYKEYLSLCPQYRIPLPEPVISINWCTFKSERVLCLVCCENNLVVEVEIPFGKRSRDMTGSYNVDTTIRSYKFKNVRHNIFEEERQDHLQKMAEAEAQREEEESEERERRIQTMNELRMVMHAERKDGQKLPEELIENKDIYGLLDTEILEDYDMKSKPEEEEKEEEDPIQFEVVNEPSPVLFARYITKDTIWLSVGKNDGGATYKCKFGNEEVEDYMRIPQAEKTSLDCYVEISGGKYLIFGLSSGKIRVVEQDNNNPINMGNYWELEMHDRVLGHVNRLCTSYDSRMLYSCGDDSNIFSYKINQSPQYYAELKSLPTRKCLLFPPSYAIDGVIRKETPTLEEWVILGPETIAVEKAKQKNEELRRRIADLRPYYLDIVEKNKKLPQSMKLTDVDFGLDPVISDYISKCAEKQVENILEELKYNIASTKIRLDKVYHYYVGNIKVFHFSQFGIWSDVKVTSYRTSEVPEEFEKADKEVKEILTEIAKKGRVHLPKFGLFPDQEKSVQPSSPSFPGVTGNFNQYLSPQDLEIYNHYVTYWQEKTKRDYEWKEFLLTKPEKKGRSPMTPELIQDYKETLLQYQLKSSPNRILSRDRYSTKIDKYNEAIESQKKIWAWKDEFNKKLLSLRSRKVEMVERMKSLLVELEYINEEVGSRHAVPVPSLPTFNMQEEFPEDQFSEYPREVPPDCPVPNRKNDGEYNVLYKGFQEQSSSCADLSIKDPDNLGKMLVTKFVADMRYKRQQRLLYRQAEILHYFKLSIEKYDMDVEKLRDKKVTLQNRIIMMEIHLLKAIRELEVIRGYEPLENSIQEKIDNCRIAKHLTILRINVKKKQIIEEDEHIKWCNQKMNQIQKTFHDLMINCKFAQALKVVYRKTFPFLEDGQEDTVQSLTTESSTGGEEIDEEGEQSSSGSDVAAAIDDDEDESTSSGELVYNTRICPEGCPQEIYETTVRLRKEKHYQQFLIVKSTDIIAKLKEIIKVIQYKERIFDTLLTLRLAVLNKILRKKQKKLDSIETVAILDTKQLQHFNIKENKYYDYDECILYSVPKLEELEENVKELKMDMSELKSSLRFITEHKVRLKKDIVHLEKYCESLKLKKRDVLIAKFGLELDYDKMEHEIMKDILLDSRYSTTEEQKNHNKVMAVLKEKKLREEEKLSIINKEHTNSLYLLDMMKKEKLRLMKLLHQKKTKPEAEHKEYISQEELEIDIKKLEKIKKEQLIVKENLTKQIYELKLKTTYKHPIQTANAYPPESPQQKETKFQIKTSSESSEEEYQSAEETTWSVGDAESESRDGTETKARVEEI